MAAPRSSHAAPPDPRAPITLRVDPRVALPPADLRVIVRVDPHPLNLAYRVEIESPDFFRASTTSLDGDRSPATQSAVWYRSLPAGQYWVTATVFRRGDPVRIGGQARVLVQVGPIDPDP